MTATYEELFAVTDADGVLGVFTGLALAEQALAGYPDPEAYVVRRRRAAPGGGSTVWFVPYSEAVNFPAYWSNDRAAAERVRDLLHRRLRATYEDPVDYWAAPVDALIPTAAARLERRHALRRELAGLSPAEAAAKLEALRALDAENLERLCGDEDGPIAQMLRENAPAISLGDAVIDDDDEPGELAAAAPQ